MKPVLFAATKPLARAENLRTVYEAYDGEKVFAQVDPWRRHREIRSGKYDLMVIDEYPTESPGKVLLIWHAIDGGKLIGLHQPYPYFRLKDAELITRAVTSGSGTVSFAAGADGIPEERVLPLGMPRTDAYFGKRKGDGQTVLAGKKAWLYAPTYRGNGETPFPDIDWDWLDGELTDDEMIAVKGHMMSGRILRKTYRHIIEIPNSEPSTPYLMDCDAVISDYSSIIFDGYLMGKPAVLLEKRKGYTETRGMYLKYPDQYCSRYCTDEHDLPGMLRKADGIGETERKCLKKVADACDGHATERVVRLVREMNGEAEGENR